MRGLRYSKRAEADLLSLVIYGAERWGGEQAVRYLLDMQDFCEALARDSGMGRSYTRKHPRWRRMEHASHIVFYRPIGRDLLVQRILHKSMQIERHLSI